MKNKFFIAPIRNSSGRCLVGNRVFPSHRSIRQAIEKQVTINYGSQLANSTGCRKKWVDWKVKMSIPEDFVCQRLQPTNSVMDKRLIQSNYDES